MKKLLLLLVIILVLFNTDHGVADEADKTEAAPEISKEDMKIIEMMETLKLMDIMEHIEVLKDMDLLIEEEGNENEK